MPRLPDVSGCSIVLVGSFNPSIFHPQWFAKQNLLSNEQAEAAVIKLVLPQVCHFETENFVLQVMDTRFVMTSQPEASPALLKDFALGTFYILEHTPVKLMGLNCMMHFNLRSLESWHKLGDTLAPKTGWTDLEGRPGLLTLTIKSEREQPKGAIYHAKVESSTRFKEGIYFEMNEQYPATSEDEPLKELMDILDKRWEEMQNHAAKVIDNLFRWAAIE
jgi:hypothetical protein